jgi:hypothetical protein
MTERKKTENIPRQRTTAPLYKDYLNATDLKHFLTRDNPIKIQRKEIHLAEIQFVFVHCGCTEITSYDGEIKENIVSIMLHL